jgi:hypothetical protein
MQGVYDMGLRGTFRIVGAATAAVGLTACLALVVQACGNNGGAGMESTASRGEQSVVQPQLPSLDVNAPQQFQTAAFAYG